jgi:hypothetical protein
VSLGVGLGQTRLLQLLGIGQGIEGGGGHGVRTESVP